MKHITDGTSPEPVTTGMSILDELAGQTGRNGQPYELAGEPDESDGIVDAHDPSDAVETFACHSQHATDLRMLDLRLLDGTRRALPYHYLEAIEFDPSAELILVFPQCRIRVSGYRLHAVYAALLGHRVGYLRALGKAALPDVDAASKSVDDGLGEAVIASIDFVSSTDEEEMA